MDNFWVKHYQDGVPESVDVDVYASMVESFEKYTAKFSNFTAFSNFGKKLTYRELDRLTQQVASYFQSQGLKKGDRIALMMPNLLQYPVCLFGALRAGLAIVNVNPLYTARELRHQLQDSGAKAIVICANFAKTLEKAISDTEIKHVVVTELGDMLGLKGKLINCVVKYIKKMVPAFSLPQAVTFADVLSIGAQQSLQSVTIGPDDIAFLQYTGGTTGPSKGAVLTHKNILANAAQLRSWVAPVIEAGKDIVVTPLPLYHIFSLLVCCISFLGLGCECLLVTNPRDMNLFVKILKKAKGTMFVGINTLYNALFHHPKINEVDFSKMKLSVSGGMATQKDVDEKWFKLTGTHILQGYGLTETSPVISINPLNITHFNGSSGLPVPSTDVEIHDDEGNSVPLGEEGEICIKGPQVMQGYWHNEDETASVFDDNGWLLTGDIGRFDEAGFLYIVDRKKDMILVSGFNVYPNEIEDVLMMHPGVKEAAAIGVPSERTGEKIKVFIVKENDHVTQEELLSFCRENLTGYKVPKVFEFRDELPTSNIGKVLRRELKDT